MPFVPYLFVLAVLAAVGSGQVAGLLFAFSTAVMKSLARLPPEHGMRAMQGINVVILNPNRLAATDAAAMDAAKVWTDYVDKWVRWNHLRTVMGIAAAMSFTLAASHLRTGYAG